MNKREFIDRLANPERCEILDWFALFEKIIPQHKVFFDIELSHYETSPGVHVFKVIAPRKSATYSFITTIRNRWQDHDVVQLEFIELEQDGKPDMIHFIYQITERNHNPT